MQEKIEETMNSASRKISRKVTPVRKRSRSDNKVDKVPRFKL